MSLFGPMTDVDRRRRQRRSLDLLVTLDRRFPDLPAIDWVVTQWSLLGESTDPDMRVRRAHWHEWVQVLGLQPQEVPGGGVLRLRATCGDYRGSGVDLGLTADILVEDERSAGTG